MQLTTERLLQLLNGVRQVGPGKWVARCPAHDDRRPSLSIAEGKDGRILLHCFAGCRTADVLQALGLTFRDLFPEGAPQTPGVSPKVIRRRAERIIDEAAEVLCFFEQAKRNLGSLIEEEPWAAMLHRELLFEYLWDSCRCGDFENLQQLKEEVRLWKETIL
uniref:Zinc finger CHC2-type domain-containing protein n=1 Tax=Candidatus Caldatribacterium saccharofermentans TaxID=1454753 RepID=A0A7V4WMA6_9BACT